jgi:hypothetical protein
MLNPLGITHVVEVAGSRSHHHRQLPDGGDDRLLCFFTLDKRHLKLDRRCIREVTEARFTGEELGLRPVCLADPGFQHLDLAQFNPNGLFAFTTGLNVRLDDALLIDDFLEVVQEEVIVRI